MVGAMIIAVGRDVRHPGRLFVAGAVIGTLAVMAMAWSPWFAVSFALLLLGNMAHAGFSTMQSTMLLLASAPEIRGRTMGASGTVNGLGHLLGGSEMGAIASAFSISLSIGLNAGAALVLMLPVIILTHLVRQPVGTISEEATHAEGPSVLKH